MTQADLFDIIDELCPHGVRHTSGGWTLEHDATSQYFKMWVHGDPYCRRPAHLRVEMLPVGWPDPPPVYEEAAPVLEVDFPIHLIAIDPGDEHVGVALFTHTADGVWRVGHVVEMAPAEACDWYANLLITTDSLETIVIERFRLYADRAASQKGSEFETAQMIGILKWLTRANNEHARIHQLKDQNPSIRLTCQQPYGGCTKGVRPRPRAVAQVLQMADIKKPAAGVLRSKGIKSVAKRLKAGGHCVDAELHGWYHLLHDLCP